MFDESKESLFMKKHFAEYYSKNFVDSVPSVENREFGFGVFKRKIANRNISFKNADEMNSFLREKTPLFFSYSNSYYSFPANTPMIEKKFIKSDLIYEFDADEIKTSCRRENNAWLCVKKFGEESLVHEIKSDGGTKQWFLEKSLIEAKKQVFRLIDLLENDFLFSRKNISVNFSGKAGYHVHLRDPTLQNLNRKSRIEIVDYLTGQGIYYDNLGYEIEKKLICASGKGAWIKRINKGIKEFFEKDAKEISLITNTPKKKVSDLLKAKKEIISGIEKGYLIPIAPRKNKEFWKSVLDFVVQTYNIPIDRQTSIDLHKIIRVPNTLHGETGFIAKEIPLVEIDKFDPFTDAVVFGEEKVKVFVKNAPKFYLKGKEFGPYNEEEVLVPLYCAIYLVGKGAELR